MFFKCFTFAVENSEKNNKMKILQVVHNFLPHPIGGVSVYTYDLSKELSHRHNICLFFIYSGNKKIVEKGEYDNIPFVAINPDGNNNNILRKMLRNRKIENEFIKLLNEFKPDVIHFQHLISLSPKLVDIAYQKKIPMLFTAHDYFLLCPQVHLVDYAQNICDTLDDKSKCIKCYMFSRLNMVNNYDWLKKAIITFLNLVKMLHTYLYILYVRPRIIKNIIYKISMFLVPSEILCYKLMKHGIPKEKLVYNDLGISDIVSVNFKKTFQGRVRFAFIGTLSFKKGCLVLLEAFKNISDATLSIYASVEEEKREQYLKSIKNKNIVLKGEFKHEKIQEIFSETDILVVPSMCMENSPLTVREAFAAKTPVIASDIGGLPEMIEHGKTGLLFRIGDVNDLTRKIQYFINNPDEISRMSNEIKPVKSIKDNAMEIEKMYLNIIEQRKI